MRAPVSASSWWKRTSCDCVADTSRTGTVTRPKLIDPVQIALRHERSPEVEVSPLQGLLPSQVVAARSKGTGRAGEPRRHVEVERPASSGSPTSTRCLYPATGFTKGQVVDYYARIAAGDAPPPRGPPGHHGAPARRRRGRAVLREALPRATAPMARAPSRSTPTPTSRRARSTDLPGLVWTANLAALELHTPQARAADPWQPTAMVFDLDPGAPADLVDCARVAARAARPARPARAARGREDVGLEGPAPVGRAPTVGRRRRDEGVRARARPASSSRATRSASP